MCPGCAGHVPLRPAQAGRMPLRTPGAGRYGYYFSVSESCPTTRTVQRECTAQALLTDPMGRARKPPSPRRPATSEAHQGVPVGFGECSLQRVVGHGQNGRSSDTVICQVFEGLVRCRQRIDRRRGRQRNLCGQGQEFLAVFPRVRRDA